MPLPDPATCIAAGLADGRCAD
ncbi:hypothetical protein IL54_0714 [Sphingobium sp. ba1]|nr:hypothetical protein IL54_0714 [Sphingobium sp. ba1]